MTTADLGEIAGQHHPDARDVQTAIGAEAPYRADGVAQGRQPARRSALRTDADGHGRVGLEVVLQDPHEAPPGLIDLTPAVGVTGELIHVFGMLAAVVLDTDPKLWVRLVEPRDKPPVGERRH